MMLDFMAYAIFLVMLDKSSPVLDYLTESQTKIVGKLVLMIAIYYGPPFLRSTNRA